LNTEQARDIVDAMVERMLPNKKAPKEVVSIGALSVKSYWCGEVLRIDIQNKG